MFRQRNEYLEIEYLHAGGIRQGEAADLNEGVTGRRPDAEGFDARPGREAMRGGGASFFAGGGVVELDDESVIAAALPAKDVVAGGESDVSNRDGGLDQEVVRILSVSRVAGRDEDDAGDDLALRVDDAGGGAHLGFDTFFLTWARAGNALCNSAEVAARQEDFGCALAKASAQETEAGQGRWSGWGAVSFEMYYTALERDRCGMGPVADSQFAEQIVDM